MIKTSRSLENDFHYKEREYQNRNKIRSSDGWLWLSVPVVSKNLGLQKIRDVKIDNSFDWRNKHWGSLKSCYTCAPFFNEHRSFFEDTYSREWDKLSDLNIHIVRYMLKTFAIGTPLYFESRLGTSTRKTDRIIELCGKLNADVYLSGAGGKAYLEEEKFAHAGIRLEYQEFRHPVYRQQFAGDKADFLPYMSAIDLLFNEGNRGAQILCGGMEHGNPVGPERSTIA